MTTLNNGFVAAMDGISDTISEIAKMLSDVNGDDEIIADMIQRLNEIRKTLDITKDNYRDFNSHDLLNSGSAVNAIVVNMDKVYVEKVNEVVKAMDYTTPDKLPSIDFSKTMDELRDGIFQSIDDMFAGTSPRKYTRADRYSLFNEEFPNLKMPFKKWCKMKVFEATVYVGATLKMCIFPDCLEALTLTNQPILSVEFTDTQRKLKVLNFTGTNIWGLHIPKYVTTIRELILAGTVIFKLDLGGSVDTIEKLDISASAAHIGLPKSMPSLKSLSVGKMAHVNKDFPTDMDNLEELTIWSDTGNEKVVLKHELPSLTSLTLRGIHGGISGKGATGINLTSLKVTGDSDNMVYIPKAPHLEDVFILLPYAKNVRVPKGVLSGVKKLTLTTVNPIPVVDEDLSWVVSMVITNGGDVVIPKNTPKLESVIIGDGKAAFVHTTSDKINSIRVSADNIYVTSGVKLEECETLTLNGNVGDITIPKAMPKCKLLSLPKIKGLDAINLKLHKDAVRAFGI